MFSCRCVSLAVVSGANYLHTSASSLLFDFVSFFCCCGTHPLWHITSNAELPPAIKQNRFQLKKENHLDATYYYG